MESTPQLLPIDYERHARRTLLDDRTVALDDKVSRALGVLRSARLIASEAKSPKLVVEKSTVPAQTGQNLQRALAVYTRKSGVKFRVASNPEFLRQSTAVSDFFHPDRIVIGVAEPGDAKQLEEIYRQEESQRGQPDQGQPRQAAPTS